jgi:hypothetical protein
MRAALLVALDKTPSIELGHSASSLIQVNFARGIQAQKKSPAGIEIGGTSGTQLKCALERQQADSLSRYG